MWYCCSSLTFFGTCLDWCSEFSCILRVKSHFIITHFYAFLFYIPCAKPVWSNCQHTSQIWVIRCFPVVCCLFRRTSREELSGSLSQAASCCACVYITSHLCCLNEAGGGLWNASSATHECRSGFRARSYSCYTRVTPKGVLTPRRVYGYLVRWSILNSDLFGLAMLCQLRHWLRKLSFLFFSETEMLSSHLYRRAIL